VLTLNGCCITNKEIFIYESTSCFEFILIRKIHNAVSSTAGYKRDDNELSTRFPFEMS